MTRIGFYAPCATMLVGCGGSVRKEPKTQATMDFPVDIVFGVADQSVQQELPENWESKFQPPGGTMETKENQVGFSFAFGLQPEYRHYVGSGFTIGALAKYQLHYPGWINEYVSQDSVEWWDPIIVQAIALRKSPSLGVLVASRAPSTSGFVCKLPPSTIPSSSWISPA